MKILEIHTIIQKETNENQRNLCENHYNYESLRNQYENYQIIRES